MLRSNSNSIQSRTKNGKKPIQLPADVDSPERQWRYVVVCSSCALRLDLGTIRRGASTEERERLIERAGVTTNPVSPYGHECSTCRVKREAKGQPRQPGRPRPRKLIDGGRS